MTEPPPACTLEHWSSSDLAPADRLAYWHDVAHNWVDVQPLSSGEALQASWSLLRSADCIFGTKQSTAYEMRTASRHVPPAEDMVVLSLLQGGEMRLNAAPGEHHILSPGMLGVYVPYQEASYRWESGARQTYVALTRREVAAALGHEPANMAIALTQCALAPMLASQLCHLSMLARQPSPLDDTERAQLLQATRALALLTLRHLGRQGQAIDPPDASEPLHRGRHAAALRFMQHHAHRHDLHANAIALGAGCSRTRLYEAFAACNDSVMSALREIRLQRACALIEQSPRLNVGALAWRCGFADPSGFSKLFRARFGLAPTEWHRRARL